MSLKTIPIQPRGRVEIRAIVTQSPGGGEWTCETKEFLNEIGKSLPKELTKLIELLSRFSETGNLFNKEKFKHLEGTDGLYEFKTTKVRLFCFWDKGGLVICTHGYVKKSQKTERQQLSRAKRLKDQYFDEKAKGTLQHETAQRRPLR
jgi:phage-related protein